MLHCILSCDRRNDQSIMIYNEFDDPRKAAAFDPELFPTCNGNPCPARDDQDGEASILRSAAAAYYDINQLLNRLHTINKESNPSARHETLRQIKQANERRNRLADQLESEGLEIRPGLSGWKTVDLTLVETLLREAPGDNDQPVEYFDFVIPIAAPENSSPKQ